MKRSLLAACAAVLALSLTGCATETPAADSSPTPTSTVDLGEHSTPTPTPQPGTKAEPHALGDLGQTNADSAWNVTIRDTSTDATAEVVGENPYNEPADGHQFVAGTIAVEINENLKPERDGQPLSPLAVMPVFVGSDGKIYTVWRRDNSAVVLTDAWTSHPDLIGGVGVTAEGRFAIEVPTDAVQGGQFAVQNQVSGDILYFGPPA